MSNSFWAKISYNGPLQIFFFEETGMKRIYIVFAALVLLFTGLSSIAEAQNYTIQQYLNIKSATAPTFSPDSKRIAYLSNVTGTSQVWTVALQMGVPRQL